MFIDKERDSNICDEKVWKLVILEKIHKTYYLG
jgi:hypothetical protein